MIEFLNNNDLAAALAAALVAGVALLIIVWLTKTVIKSYRAYRVYRILKAGLEERKRSFLTTEYLSSKSGYTGDEVEALCLYQNGVHGTKRIRRNEKKRETWCIEKRRFL